MAELNQEQLKKIESKKQISRHSKTKVFFSVLLAIILILLLWGAIYTTADVNSYRIVVSGKRGGSLSLSFDANFSKGFSVLKGLGVQSADNTEGISYTEGISDYIQKVASGEIPMEIEANKQEGKAGPTAGGDQFIASKFYLKNISDSSSLKYKLRINVLENTNNALSAARFMVIRDTEGEYVQNVYAQPRSNGEQEKVSTLFRGSDSFVKDPNNIDNDWQCTNLALTENNFWHFDSYDLQNVTFELAPEEVVGYLVCVWYEGSDPDHCNDILGGYITFNVTFTQVE